MPGVQARSLPDTSLLQVYRQNGAYTDCYTVDVPAHVTQAQFVQAFYTTALFRLERSVLQRVLSFPSTDDEAQQLAEGQRDTFSAWHVEVRCPDQLLMCDYQQRTRSWLMTAPMANEGRPGTRLHFGTAVLPVRNRRTGRLAMGAAFHALLGAHKLYSVFLLRAARARLMRSTGT